MESVKKFFKGIITLLWEGEKPMKIDNFTEHGRKEWEKLVNRAFDILDTEENPVLNEMQILLACVSLVSYESIKEMLPDDEWRERKRAKHEMSVIEEYNLKFKDYYSNRKLAVSHYAEMPHPTIVLSDFDEVDEARYIRDKEYFVPENDVTCDFGTGDPYNCPCCIKLAFQRELEEKKIKDEKNVKYLDGIAYDKNSRLYKKIRYDVLNELREVNHPKKKIKSSNPIRLSYLCNEDAYKLDDPQAFVDDAKKISVERDKYMAEFTFDYGLFRKRIDEKKSIFEDKKRHKVEQRISELEAANNALLEEKRLLELNYREVIDNLKKERVQMGEFCATPHVEDGLNMGTGQGGALLGVQPSCYQKSEHNRQAHQVLEKARVYGDSAIEMPPQLAQEPTHGMGGLQSHKPIEPFGLNLSKNTNPGVFPEFVNNNASFGCNSYTGTSFEPSKFSNCDDPFKALSTAWNMDNPSSVKGLLPSNSMLVDTSAAMTSSSIFKQNEAAERMNPTGQNLSTDMNIFEECANVTWNQIQPKESEDDLSQTSNKRKRA